MRRTLLLYLVPLVQVLFAREWQALWRALAQDLALFCLLALVSAVMLRASSWELDAAGVLHLRWDLILSFERRIQNSQLAAVQIERPMLYCLAGASRVTLYPALLPKGQAVTLHLTRRDARMLADRMMPAPQQEIYHPAGGQRLAFALLGANSLSTLLLVALALRQGDNAARADRSGADQPGGGLGGPMAAGGPGLGAHRMDLPLWAEPGAQLQSYPVFTGCVAGAAACWPAGADCWCGWSAGSVWTASPVPKCACPPGARLLRCYPVYLTAGCCNIDAPLFVYRAGQEDLVRRLLPGFQMPPRQPFSLAWLRGRSLVFLAPAGGCLGFLILLLLVASWALPAALPLLALPALVCAFWLVCEIEGLLREGAWPTEKHLTFLRQRRMSMHCVCVFSPATALRISQSPWGVLRGAGHPDLCLSRPPAGTGAQHPAVRRPGLRGLFGKE